MKTKNIAEEDQVIEVIETEEEDFYSDDDLYNINSWGADLSFRELVQMYKDGDLVKPELQRNYVWDKSEASRFIDSILLGLPVPSIFLAKTRQEKLLIVDGYQRIMTIYDYMEQKIFRTDGKAFKLINSSKINSRWRGKTIDELSDTEQRKIRNATIHCIIFVQIKPRDDDTSMYQVFERINTSGRTLMPQEIRNCVYQGKFNTTLLELNNNKSWRSLYGLSNPDSRMRDIEFILRFFALSSQKWSIKSKGSISLKKYLNVFMGNNEAHKTEILEHRKEMFVKTVKFILDHFGEDAFQNISVIDPSKSAGKFNPTIFDSLMIATYIALNSKEKIVTEQLSSRRMKLLQNNKFQDLVRFRTTNEDRIAKRITLALKTLYGLKYA